MTAPLVGLQRFAVSCVLGVGLGIWYGFLRPLRPRHTALSDTVFLTGAVWVWLQLMFGICRGDLRISAFAGLILGAVGWDAAFGRLVEPLFRLFWAIPEKVFHVFSLPVKKICKTAKILFASWKKWVTIKWSNRRMKRHFPGGTIHGRTRNPKAQH